MRASRAATQIVDWIVSHINMYFVCASIGRLIYIFFVLRAQPATHTQHIYNSIMLACRAIPFRMRLPRNDFVFVAHFDGCAWIDLKCFSHHRRSIERATKNIWPYATSSLLWNIKFFGNSIKNEQNSADLQLHAKKKEKRKKHDQPFHHTHQTPFNLTYSIMLNVLSRM